MMSDRTRNQFQNFLRLPLRVKLQFISYYFFNALHLSFYAIVHFYNIARLGLAGVRTGKNFSSHGAMIINIYPGSEVILGQNVSAISDSRRSNASALAFPVKIRTFSPSSKILIGDNVGLNGTSITSRSRPIIIGSGTMIAPNVIIVDSDFHKPWPPKQRLNYPGNELDREVIIGKNSWIGMNTIILKGVTIGDNCIIGAGSVVVHDIPGNSLAAGSPARVIKVYNQGSTTSPADI
ncbi:MAG: acyltransferase [Methanoregula sp.]|uniref:acyltransferase n=1 Tax=Methanoregula sp. TaxID=2052170 RepID=UPI003C1CF85A